MPQERTSGSAAGFTLLELLVVVAVVGFLSALGVTSYLEALHRARVTRAIADIKTIEKELFRFEADAEELPATLGDIGMELTDPWGNPYQYFPFVGPGWRGRARKDRFLVPINSTFDLYSSGPDGESRAPLTARPSWDDIIRAGDGNFVGPASEF